MRLVGKYQKKISILLVIFNMLLIVAVVFLMTHVQNLLNSDVRVSLMEIVNQNKSVISSKLMLDINNLGIVSNKITESFKNKKITNDEDIKEQLSFYSQTNYDDSVFVADIDGTVVRPDGEIMNVSGRRYFKLALENISNISDKTISRFNGEDVFIASVPLYYNNKIIGTVQKVYTAQQMDDLFSMSLFAKKGYMYVVNSEGYVILHSEHENCYQKSDNYFRDVYENGNKEAVGQLQKDIKNNKSSFMEAVIGGEKTFSAYTPIDQIHDWYLVTSVPIDVIAKNSNVVINMFYIILFAIVLIFSSITSYFLWNKNKQKEILEKIAFVDTVTQGATYNKFVVDVENILLNNSDKQFYILKFDIDNFKYINSFYGFEFGDKLLKQINEEISSKLEEDEILSRVSGDYFVAFLNNADETRIKELLTLVRNEKELVVYFSAGVYAVEDYAESINLMVDKAGTAAQRVKGMMNKKIAYYSKKFDDMTIHNEQLKRALDQAFEKDEFIVFYQPKVDINNNKLVGAEALVRWRNNDKIISPGEFIPLCENTGLIIDLDMLVFDKVLAFLRKSLDAGIDCVPISVNFSRLHLTDEDFLSKILKKIDEYQVPTHLIELELTESAIFDNLDTIYEFSKMMRENGFAIAMDDFGSGYSSLNMLKDIPIDTLKIDREFLVETADNSKRNIIFTSIVDMAKKLGIKLVVEGVEYVENVNLMMECGCDIAQGYYFAKPMHESNFEQIFRDGKV